MKMSTPVLQNTPLASLFLLKLPIKKRVECLKKVFMFIFTHFTLIVLIFFTEYGKLYIQSTHKGNTL